MDPVATGLSGLNVTAQSLNLTASNVANADSAGYQARALRQQDLAQGGVAPAGVEVSQAAAVPGGSNVDLATELTGLGAQGITYQADLTFMKAQQSLIGAALDMKA